MDSLVLTMITKKRLCSSFVTKVIFSNENLAAIKEIMLNSIVNEDFFIVTFKIVLRLNHNWEIKPDRICVDS